LWVFGRSLERLFGLPIFFVAFPFLGIAGLLAHWSLFPASRAPVIGASGAIATLMGAYLALFPAVRMRMVLFLGIFFKRFQVPAWAFLLYWGALQVLSLMFGSGGEDNVAYAVHVGGFAVGVLSAVVWKVTYPFAEERLLNSFKWRFRARETRFQRNHPRERGARRRSYGYGVDIVLIIVVRGPPLVIDLSRYTKYSCM
jgi:membrane associated rhomboid family serine protease